MQTKFRQGGVNRKVASQLEGSFAKTCHVRFVHLSLSLSLSHAFIPSFPLFLILNHSSTKLLVVMTR